MADKAEATIEAQRSQFTLRDLLVQVALVSVVLALVATRSEAFMIWVPSVIVVSVLAATRFETARGAVYGFTAAFVASTTIAMLQAATPRSDPGGVVLRLLVLASIGAWLGASIHAIRLRRLFVGGAFLALCLPFVTLLVVGLSIAAIRAVFGISYGP